MKRLIFIPFLLFSLIASATDYYVKNGGNDAASGLDDDNAWETIAKVNSVSFSPDDCIYFKKGDTFVGTLTPLTSGTSGHYITFDAYGDGADPIITPNDEVEGITWTVHSGSVYKTTDIGYNPGNILIDGVRKINKINDYWVTHIPSDGRYGNLGAMALLALPENQTYSINGQNIYFWDGLDALYCYNSSTGTTYLRFRGGEDPNDSTFAIAVDGSRAVYLHSQGYIKVRNLNIVGGEYGIEFDGLASNNNIVEYCTIESSNGKVWSRNANHDNIVRHNDITNNYLSSYLPGAWANGTTYIQAVCRHYYEFGKYRIDISDSTNIDCAFKMRNQSDNTLVYNNTISKCTNGIFVAGYDCEIYNNTIDGTSSIGIYFERTTEGSEAHDNYLTNTNIAFRFGYIDDVSYPDRVNYVYRNRVYSPDAGESIKIHYSPSKGVSTMEAYIYHNSVICNEGINCSWYAGENEESTGFVFVNNIFSISGYNTYGWPGMATHDDLFIFYYNWVGGYYYGAGSGIAVWATDASNLNNVGSTFWDHEVNPPDFTDIIGTEVVDAGIDVSTTFYLNEIEYSALPGTNPGDYYDEPDIGYYEYDEGGGPIEPLVIFTTTIYPHDIWALAGGNVYYDGGGTVDQRGVCWSESENPTISDSHTSDGSGAGIYTSTLTGLEENTTYFCRAYAHNEIGYGYGSQIEFTTTTETIIIHGGKIVFHNGKIKVRK